MTGARLQELVLLTRRGCAGTPMMQANLDEALRALGSAGRYEVMDVERLPEADPRRAYPTPTVLYRGHDLFGMAEPTPPFPEPA